MLTNFSYKLIMILCLSSNLFSKSFYFRLASFNKLNNFSISFSNTLILAYNPLSYFYYLFFNLVDAFYFFNCY